MKILHILDHSLPLHSGYTFRSLNILRSQRKRGWQPVVVTSPKHEESWKQDTRECEEIEGIRHYRTGSVPPSCLPFVSELRLMKRLTKRILEVSSKEKPDILHAHSPVLNAYPAIYAGRKLGIPVVYEIRAFWEDAAVDHGSYAEGSLKYKLTRYLETCSCRQADHVAILCHGLKDDLVSRGIPADKISVVYNGVNPQDFKPTEPDSAYFKQWHLEGKTVIGFIGSFYRYEGLDLLLQAFSSISAENSHVILLLVGGGEMEDSLRREAEALGLSSKVIMPGRISHARIPGIYALTDILVYPRHPMRLTDLVTPLKPLEAMAMGKVVIASNVGGHRELIRNNKTALLFKAGDAIDLAHSLTMVLSDASLRRSMEIASATWVRSNHTWEKTTTVYEPIYLDLKRQSNK